MEQRFSRNIPTISEAEQHLLRKKRAAIIGCGGLGGYLIEFLARGGVGAITLADGDFFEESNLNRQNLSLPSIIGHSKASTAAARVKDIDPAIEVSCHEEFFSAENADSILENADIVLDALDNIPARLLLEAECAKRGLYLVHGAVQGLSAQVCVVPPGSGVLRRLYGEAGGSENKSVLPHVPPFCAALQSGEAIKLLCGRASELESRLLIADLGSMDFITMEL